MSSFFDDASLVFIPSGYKTSKAYSVKPTDGSGDLAFSRSNDTATRVGPDGLIEKVRTNLAIQSNSFTTSWSATNATLTSGQAGYDGTTNAWSLLASGANARIDISNTSTGLLTFSVYAKAGTSNFTRLRFDYGAAYVDRYFNLSTGALAGTFFAPLDSKIESVGGGWYRCSVTLNQTISTIRVYAADADLGGSASGNILIQNAQLESGDIATEPILTTTAAVSVGPVANVPRLDYLNSSCPRLLLEPQRVNLALFSESFDNASWTKTAAGTGVTPVVTANSAISPDGYQNADTIVFNVGAGTTSSDQSYINQTLSVTSGSTYAFSVYLKGSVGGEQLIIRNASGSYSLLTLSNEWQRFSVTAAAASTGYAAHFGLRQGVAGTLNSTATVYAYGAQVELGSYPSSYVNTLGAAVTRGADNNVQVNPSTLVGATAGSWFMDVADYEFEIKGTTLASSWIGDGEADFIGFTGRTGGFDGLVFTKRQSNTSTTIFATASKTLKACFTWNGSSLKLFVDGVKVYDNNSFANFAAWNNFQLNYATREASYKLNQTLLFPTQLSDADAIALTA